MIRIRGDAYKDTHICASGLWKALLQASSCVTSVLNGSPNRFQEQPLLWINYPGFFRGDVEEGRIKFIKVVQEATPLAVNFSFQSGGRIGMIELLIIPALRRHEINQIFSLLQVFPIFLQIAGVRVVPMYANDRDRFPARCRAICGWFFFDYDWWRLRLAGGSGRTKQRDQCFSRILNQELCEVADGFIFIKQSFRQRTEILFQTDVDAIDYYRINAKRL